MLLTFIHLQHTRLIHSHEIKQTPQFLKMIKTTELIRNAVKIIAKIK